MAESEKLTALKKAYADIILNTAKEAAARIMVSERKAQRYQRELFAAKDEALRMLVKLKQMLDFKVSEAEKASLSQQKRIEELEAQLGEAEDIVKDLRTELQELQNELEKVTINKIQDELENTRNNKMLAFGEQNSEGDITTRVGTSEENRVSTPGSVVSPSPTTQCDLDITLDTKNSTLHVTYDGNNCYNENGSHEDNCFVCNCDFASIMMRSKEPELYRNGCTQRIRAFEGNMLGGNISLPGKADGAKNQILVREDEGGNHIYQKLTIAADKMCSVEKAPDELKVMKVDSVELHANRSFSRKRKRAARYKKRKAPLFKSSPDLSENCAVQSVENIAQKDPVSPVVAESPSPTNEMIMRSRSVDVTNRNAELLRACSALKTSNQDKMLVDELELNGEETRSAERFEHPASKTDLEMASVLLVNLDQKESVATALPSEPMRNKFLKYTFRRKRKKESLSSPDRESAIDNSILKRKMDEKQSGSLESQKCSLITESSRDSRRVAQVARQLISLSEKKWC